jgi:hypothetical protein
MGTMLYGRNIAAPHVRKFSTLRTLELLDASVVDCVQEIVIPSVARNLLSLATARTQPP